MGPRAPWLAAVLLKSRQLLLQPWDAPLWNPCCLENPWSTASSRITKCRPTDLCFGIYLDLPCLDSTSFLISSLRNFVQFFNSLSSTNSCRANLCKVFSPSMSSVGTDSKQHADKAWIRQTAGSFQYLPRSQHNLWHRSFQRRCFHLRDHPYR